MRPRRSGRKIALSLAGLSLLSLLLSAWRLAERIEAWNEANAPPVFYFIPVTQTTFTFAGRPVSITGDIDEKGEGDVVITYGDDTLHLPVEIPNDLPLPGLARYSDWLRLHVFAEASDMTFEEFERRLHAGEITSRLVAVVRKPLAAPAEKGHFGLETGDDWAWGESRRDRWMFTFYEFLPEGGWRTQTLRFPESGAHFYRRQIRAQRRGEPPPKRAEDELVEGSWQYQAAIPLMHRPPSITTEQQALRNAGWTLPAASTSVVVLILSLAFAFAPGKSGKGQDAPPAE